MEMETIDKLEERLYRIEFLLEKLMKLRRQTIQSPWLTAEEAGEYLSMNPHVLRQKARAGKIKYYRHPGTRRMWFHVADLDAFVRRFDNEEKRNEEKTGEGTGSDIFPLYPSAG